MSVNSEEVFERGRHLPGRQGKGENSKPGALPEQITSLNVLGIEQRCSVEISETLDFPEATLKKSKRNSEINFDTVFYVDMCLK